MAELSVHGPFAKGDLYDDLGTHTMRAQARQPLGFGEGRLCDLERVQLPAEIEEQLRVEAGADLPGKHKVIALEVTDEQGAQADPSTLRIREPTSHELLRRLALHFQPVRRSAMLVWRTAALRDH